MRDAGSPHAVRASRFRNRGVRRASGACVRPARPARARAVGAGARTVGRGRWRANGGPWAPGRGPRRPPSPYPTHRLTRVGVSSRRCFCGALAPSSDMEAETKHAALRRATDPADRCVVPPLASPAAPPSPRLGSRARDWPSQGGRTRDACGRCDVPWALC